MVLTVNFSCITDQVSNDQRSTKQVTKSRYGIVAYWCETLPVGFDIKHGLYWHDSIVRRGPPGLPRRKRIEQGRDRSSRRLRAFRIFSFAPPSMAAGFTQELVGADFLHLYRKVGWQ
jgi:hypothetical protein